VCSLWCLRSIEVCVDQVLEFLSRFSFEERPHFFADTFLPFLELVMLMLCLHRRFLSRVNFILRRKLDSLYEKTSFVRRQPLLTENTVANVI